MKFSKRWFTYLGPGLLYAGAAIGVSHLVQSTRAGALFGFQLFGLIVIVNILKYPFFETGSRYAGATDKTLIQAYGAMSRKLLWFYLVQTFVTMFIIQFALTIVTAGLLKALLNLQIEVWVVSSIISLACMFILFIGQYTLLKQFTKWIVIALTVCTLLAVLLATLHPVHLIENTDKISWQNTTHLAFIVALLGWMPAPIDISVWQSVWRVDGKEKGSLQQSLTDFHVGYWGTAIISLSFLSLGALIFFHSGEKLAQSGSLFSVQLINMYTTAIGKWAWPVVSFAAFATMFTSCLTCLDANPRVILRTTQELGFQTSNKLYIILIVLSAISAVTIPLLSGKNMTQLVDFATTVSFLTAPIFATLNYTINFGKELNKNQQPGILNKCISWVGLIGLYGFAFYYIYQKFLKHII